MTGHPSHKFLPVSLFALFGDLAKVLDASRVYLPGHDGGEPRSEREHPAGREVLPAGGEVGGSAAEGGVTGNAAQEVAADKVIDPPGVATSHLRLGCRPDGGDGGVVSVIRATLSSIIRPVSNSHPVIDQTCE